MSQRLLVTVLGTNPKPARYALAESSVEPSLAPLALVRNGVQGLMIDVTHGPRHYALTYLAIQGRR